MTKYEVGEMVICQKRNAYYGLKIESRETGLFRETTYSGKIIYLKRRGNGFEISKVQVRDQEVATKGKTSKVKESLLTRIEDPNLLEQLSEEGFN